MIKITKRFFTNIFYTTKSKNFKEEYLNIPTLYLVGIPLGLGLCASSSDFLSKPIKLSDKRLNLYYTDSVFWRYN